jgi:hypothetical protein
VQSPCNPLIEDYTEIFHIIGKGDSPSIQCKTSLRVPNLCEEYIDFYVPTLTLRLNSTETSMQLTENITLFAACNFHYIASGQAHRKHLFFYCCVLIHCCRDVFTAPLRSNERGANSQRTPLATTFLSLRDVTAYVTRSSAARIRVIT